MLVNLAELVKLAIERVAAAPQNVHGEPEAVLWSREYEKQGARKRLLVAVLLGTEALKAERHGRSEVSVRIFRGRPPRIKLSLESSYGSLFRVVHGEERIGQRQEPVRYALDLFEEGPVELGDPELEGELQNRLRCVAQVKRDWR